MARKTHFRSPRIRKLAALAVSQGFEERYTGTGLLALKCPRCGEETVLSMTARDASARNYLNQETMFRRHGLNIPGKPAREECISNARKG